MVGILSPFRVQMWAQTFFMPKISIETINYNLAHHQRLDVFQDSVRLILKAFNWEKIPFNFFEFDDLLEQNMECFNEILSDLRLTPNYLNVRRYFATFEAGKVRSNSSSSLKC